MTRRTLNTALFLTLLAGCASSPVTFFTLAPVLSLDSAPSSSVHAPVVYVPRMVFPDYLDSQDIVLREGSRLIRSPNGRWASRLSQSATDLIVARLAHDWRTANVTTHAPIETPSLRLGITVERLDMTTDGHAALLATWTALPKDESRPVRQGRTQLSVEGSVQDDAAQTALLQTLFRQLADRIAQDGAPNDL